MLLIIAGFTMERQYDTTTDMSAIELPKPDNEEDEVVETDPEQRYYRYNEVRFPPATPNMSSIDACCTDTPRGDLPRFAAVLVPLFDGGGKLPADSVYSSWCSVDYLFLLLQVVGRGRFKTIYKAFDTQIGIDVAWSKVSSDTNHLTLEQLRSVHAEMQKGLELEHPNIIKCFKCWEGADHSINLITELFTSGNLRQYR